MINKTLNLVGGGDCWATDANGAIQVQTLDANDTGVTFTNVPAVDGYGYKVWLDRDGANTPSADPPTQSGNLSYTTPVNGKFSVTCTFASAVTAAQAGTVARLRIIK